MEGVTPEGRYVRGANPRLNLYGGGVGDTCLNRYGGGGNRSVKVGVKEVVRAPEANIGLL